MGRKKKKCVAPVGRPPAPWFYELLKLDLPGDSFLDYYELSEKLGVTVKAVHGVCAKLGIPGEYYRTSTKGIRKRFYLRDLKRCVSAYLKFRGQKEV